MEQLSQLVDKALQIRNQAYAPYSNYQVGAALITATGRVYTGCNVENAVYSATVCAERVAVFKAVSEGDRDFVAMAVAASGDEIATPCGTCRQVLYEFAPDLILYLTDAQGKRVEKVPLADLLPRPFGPVYFMEEC
ncbi:MAG: cytidine deaminase [bacterium]|jgi:cytidine deaminase